MIYVLVKLRGIKKLSFSAFSQTKVPVYFYFPHDDTFEIRVDSGKIYKDEEILLSEGLHSIEIWVPGLKIMYDTISINAKTTNVFRYTSTITGEHLVYQNNLKKYKREKTAAIFPPATTLSATGISAGFATFFYIKGRKLAKDYNYIQENYPTSIDSEFLLESQDNLYSIFDEYTRVRKLYYYSLASTIVLGTVAGIMVKRYHWDKKRPTPNYLDSPFSRNDKLSLSVKYSLNSVHLTLSL